MRILATVKISVTLGESCGCMRIICGIAKRGTLRSRNVMGICIDALFLCLNIYSMLPKTMVYYSKSRKVGNVYDVYRYYRRGRVRDVTRDIH